jgi:dolichol-phosphate mannosyltransferase
VSDVRLTPDSADFRLLDRACVDALNSMPERLKFFRGMVPYIGFSQTTLAFDCPPRVAGQRSYTLGKSLRLASNGILSFSTMGLKLPFLVGLLVLGVSVAYLLVAAILLALGVVPIQRGWTSLVVLFLFGMGLQLTFLGMFGLYLGKMFVEIKQRPLYFVRRTVNLERPVDHAARHGATWIHASSEAEATRVAPLGGRQVVDQHTAGEAARAREAAE